ncbi:hypothetical protein BpHYR1_004801 [Brachionus plicatilis]|uniref:Uncharacterized protein n=1 Tax=Brachionus plicatilis TaxID=10195 RepID=A0A3M7PWU1_BRAPC|nr:hypothetical protein BpHYR1_004801 [Brachionus plicatilis]
MFQIELKPFYKKTNYKEYSSVENFNSFSLVEDELFRVTHHIPKKIIKEKEISCTHRLILYLNIIDIFSSARIVCVVSPMRRRTIDYLRIKRSTGGGSTLPGTIITFLCVGQGDGGGASRIIIGSGLRTGDGAVRTTSGGAGGSCLSGS